MNQIRTDSEQVNALAAQLQSVMTHQAVIAAQMQNLVERMQGLKSEMASNYVAFEGWARHFAQGAK